MLNVIWNIGVFIITFSVLVTVHELGHFFVARYYGVKINRFSIGFGKSIFKFNLYDTEFVVSIFPVGGYVKMLDERACEVPLHLLHKTFNRKPIWQRIFIILAGPIANLIMAIFIYSILFFQIGTMNAPVIGKVIEDSVIGKAHINSGAEIKKVDNIVTPDWDTVRMALMSKHKNSTVTLTFANINENIIYKKEFNLNKLNFDLPRRDPLLVLGIIPYPIVNFLVTKISDINMLNKYNLKEGDIITKLDGNILLRSQPFINYVKYFQKKNIEIEINRNNKILKFKTDANELIQNNIKNNILITSQTVFPKNYKIIHRYNIFAALRQSLIKTWQIIKMIVDSIFNLINGNYKLDNLSGPITIAKGATASAKLGIMHYLFFLSLISINISLFNLLPLPILDGGHILFLIIEKLTGKPLSDQAYNIFSWVGFSILIILITIALSNDFSKFTSNL
ncbi:RIP metalloprotease RseP [Candidatus Pantoea edessiphila]|uniref:Zinc metalloprotease n=1 Tax=Candidatus Pantoea edessiphila TaxID=2044610 RepID=A0A2P5SY18_9GAMM|nr:RIP metalloprotease RseP [Candidatus Pantoea edessiphila]MBK4775562.1 RIP metalloprotease RseP [Pantoea sp. Edef]PPI87215.1 RIP metalloprotease RseP [Candidatus Pantoea edessiphila]